MQAELKDSLEFLYADSEVGAMPHQTVTVDVARGGTISMHFLLNSLGKGDELRLALRKRGRIVSSAQWLRLVHVPVESNTSPLGFTEKAGERNPFVARRAPFRVFDAMEPVRDLIIADAPTTALRVQWSVSRDEEIGRHDFSAEIVCAHGIARFLITAIVHKSVIPETSAETLPYTNWFSFELMATRHGLNPWGEAHWRMIERYAQLMVHARQNTFWCPLHDVFVVKKGIPELNRSRLRRIVEIFTRVGMHYIEGGHLAARTGGNWKATTFDVTLSSTRATSPEGNVFLSRIARSLMEEIRQNGWSKRWLQHVTDEPSAENAVDYRILGGMVRKYMPGIPLLDATMDTSLVGSVDIWCPQAQEYQHHQAEFEAQRKVGDRVWFYTCCFPGGPWLNRLLDMELLRSALFGWGAARFSLDGFLHWGLNHYRPTQNPFHTSVVDHGGGNSLPAGDTHIVYPGNKEPWSSLRLEAQREGFEDYELLKRLKAVEPRAADQIIYKVIRGFDDYTKDTGVFRSARKALLNAL